MLRLAILKLAEYLRETRQKTVYVFFLHQLSLNCKKTNTSDVVIGCRENIQLYKSFDMHFNLDNKEYSLTLENREKKTKNKRADCVMLCQQSLFLQHI